MTIKDKMHELKGTLKEEWNEHSDDPKDQRDAMEGRAERNAARVAQGKAPLTGKPGSGA